MPGFRAALKDYLEHVGGLEPARLGGDEPTPPDPRSGEELVRSLTRQSQFNNRIIIVMVSLHVLLFVAALALVVWKHDSPGIVSVVGGGSLLALLAITKSLQRLWREKNATDLLTSILPSLAPDEVLKIVTATYYGQPGAGNE